MPDIAAFDFDGTLTDGGSVFGFLAAVTDRRTVLTASVAFAPRLARAALAGGEVADQTKELLFVRVLAGIDEAQLADVAARFAEGHLAAHLRDDVRRQLDWHRSRGDLVAIVSASPECYVTQAGHRLGADVAIATRLEVGADGRLTGRYDGKNCRGEEKLRRLRQWIGERSDDWRSGGGHSGNETAPRLWAYGNSRGDLRMLAAADVGVNVGRLGSLGRLRDFYRLDEVAGSSIRAEPHDAAVGAVPANRSNRRNRRHRR